MGARVPSSSEEQVLADYGQRLRSLEAIVRDRAFPPGYHVREVSGNLVIVRDSDGLTSTLVFA